MLNDHGDYDAWANHSGKTLTIRGVSLPRRTRNAASKSPYGASLAAVWWQICDLREIPPCLLSALSRYFYAAFAGDFGRLRMSGLESRRAGGELMQFKAPSPYPLPRGEGFKQALIHRIFSALGCVLPRHAAADLRFGNSTLNQGTRQNCICIRHGGHRRADDRCAACRRSGSRRDFVDPGKRSSGARVERKARSRGPFALGDR